MTLTSESHARIGYEQVDRSDIVFHTLDQCLHGCFVTDIDDPRCAPDIGGHACGCIGLEVRNNHSGTVPGQAPAQCTADAVPAPGYDGNVDVDSHSLLAAASGRFRSCAGPQCSNILYAQEVVQCCAC
jgi:hypothetical protein